MVYFWHAIAKCVSENFLYFLFSEILNKQMNEICDYLFCLIPPDATVSHLDHSEKSGHANGLWERWLTLALSKSSSSQYFTNQCLDSNGGHSFDQGYLQTHFTSVVKIMLMRFKHFVNLSECEWASICVVFFLKIYLSVTAAFHAVSESFSWLSMALMRVCSRGTSLSAEARLPDEGTWMRAAFLWPWYREQ